jgi:hypothetical protein
VKQVEARVDRVSEAAQPNSARPAPYEGDVRDLWLARVRRLETKLTKAERDLIAEGADAPRVRALAEAARGEIATLKALATDASNVGESDEIPPVWTKARRSRRRATAPNDRLCRPTDRDAN